MVYEIILANESKGSLKFLCYQVKNFNRLIKNKRELL